MMSNEITKIKVITYNKYLKLSNDFILVVETYDSKSGSLISRETLPILDETTNSTCEKGL